jgi:BirA family biotin operon repressor/biotin-[acetyl-CoA-carboxylase] ligase
MAERSSVKEIRKHLKECAKDIIIETVDEISSTNDEMKSRGNNAVEEISLLIAESQTKGKGRKGRSFFSPDSSGCYMSFLLRPDYSAEECTLLTAIAAVATAEAIETVTDKKAQIKWVNDIYIERRKVAGILTEAVFRKDGKGLSYAVVGIGINVCTPDGGFPEEIKNIAAAISDSKTEIKNRLIAEIINRFVYYYKNMPKKEYITSYRDRIFFLGEDITVIEADKTYSAIAKDIDDMCHLIVALPDGKTKHLFSGEISIKPKL